jgi:hypothetical protein
VGETVVTYMRADAPYKTIHDMVKAKEPAKCGSSGTASGDYMLSKLFGRLHRREDSNRVGLPGYLLSGVGLVGYLFRPIGVLRRGLFIVTAAALFVPVIPSGEYAALA